MANAKNSERPTDSPEPAAQTRGRDRVTPPPEDDDSAEASALAQADATLTLVSAWLGNFQTLIRLEFSRTLAAGKRIIALNLLLLPLVVALVLSLCGGAGLIGYRISQSIYVGFTVFILAQIFVLAGILLYQRQLSAMLGFHETRRQAQQAKEALSDVFDSFK
ncbi:hypothetical protein [Microbulbifer marinus]|uniref:Uncharacterized protein n=1 Tax=Microbulbifer marinus TaxID=658218 RepID=A0A1H4AL04_9GAMM|nr:hypothetical protein [Microbulbifer marinus]SEA36649.1 hypothetical protein SAMN05216562_2858 [Microbulbifer marinus]